MLTRWWRLNHDWICHDQSLDICWQNDTVALQLHREKASGVWWGYLTWSSVPTDHTQLHAVVGGRPVALRTPGRGNPGGGGVRRTGGVRGGQLGRGGASAEVQGSAGVHFQGWLAVKLPVGRRPHQLEGWLDGDFWFRRMRISCGRPWAGFDCQAEVPRLLQFSEFLMPFPSVARSRKSLQFIWKMTLCREKLPVALCINDDNKTAKPF